MPENKGSSCSHTHKLSMRDLRLCENIYEQDRNFKCRKCGKMGSLMTKDKVCRVCNLLALIENAPDDALHLGDEVETLFGHNGVIQGILYRGDRDWSEPIYYFVNFGPSGPWSKRHIISHSEITLAYRGDKCVICNDIEEGPEGSATPVADSHLL